MNKRRLGDSKITLSLVGIGGMSFTNFYGETNETQSHYVLNEALDLGINHIDTSNVYGMGKSESIIGRFLSKQGKTSQDRFHIATKAGITRDKDTGKRIFDNSKKHLTTELEASLKRLGIECVDLFYIHRRDKRVEIEEVTETLAQLVKAGKIKHFGFSEISPSTLKRAGKVQGVAAVQSEYSLAVRSPELGIVQTTAKEKTTLVAFSPVGRGLLTNSPHHIEDIKKMDFVRQIPRFQEPNLKANIDITNKFRELAAEMGVATASLAIAWILAQADNIVTIPGTRSPKHLRELAKGAGMVLTKGDLDAIEKTLPIGWAHGDRYSDEQWNGPERYC